MKNLGLVSLLVIFFSILDCPSLFLCYTLWILNNMQGQSVHLCNLTPHEAPLGGGGGFQGAIPL